MSATAHRAGDFVLPAFGGERPSLTVVVRAPDDVLVDSVLMTELGFDEAQGLQAKREFAATLNEVTCLLADEPRDVVARSARGVPDRDLGLGEEACAEVLGRLRGVGAALRGLLSDDLVEKMRAHGFPGGDPDEEELTLTFVESGSPVLWEMLYEGPQAEPADWRQFWGFRVPVTHWMVNRFAPACEAIVVRNGLFSAVSEDLPGTGREVEGLARLAAGPRHVTLAEALRE